MTSSKLTSITSKRVFLSALITNSLLTAVLGDYVSYPVSKNKFVKERLEKRDSNDVLQFVIDNEEAFYSVDLVIGSNEQKLSALLDTGSSDLWVLGADSNNITACDAYLEYAGYVSSSSSKKRDSSVVSKRGNLPHHVSPLLDSDISEETDNVGLAARDNDYETYSTLYGTATAYSSATGSSSGGSYSSALQEEISYVEANCNDMGVFTPSDSTSFQKNHTSAEFFIQYGDNTFADGYWGSDKLTINGIAVEGLLFGVANISNSSNVLGISFPQLESSFTSTEDSSSFTYSNLPQLLKQSGFINKVVYSLFLNSLEASSGELLFGALDTSKYTGSLHTVPLINIYSKYYDNPTEFDITLQGSGYVSSSGNTKTFSTQYLSALLDSGTTLTYLPTDLADMFASQVSAKWDSDLQYYTMTCPTDSVAQNSAFVFQFGGVNYYVPLSNYILETSESNTCVLGIQPQTSQFCILGDNTLSALYLVYDLEDYEVSIAQANYGGSSDSNIKEISSSIPGATSAPGYSNTWTATVSSITSGGNIFNSSSASNPWTATSSIYFESTSIATGSAASGNASKSASTTVSGSASSSSGSHTAPSTSSSAGSSSSSNKKNAGNELVAGSGSVLMAAFLALVF